MFESNFPVDKLSCSYPVLWNAFKRVAADFTPDEKALLFHDTAARVYRLAGEGSSPDPSSRKGGGEALRLRSLHRNRSPGATTDRS